MNHLSQVDILIGILIRSPIFEIGDQSIPKKYGSGEKILISRNAPMESTEMCDKIWMRHNPSKGIENWRQFVHFCLDYRIVFL